MFLADEVGLIRSPDTLMYSIAGGGQCRALRTYEFLNPGEDCENILSCGAAQNFRQSYMLSTDRIEIHQSQPA